MDAGGIDHDIAPFRWVPNDQGASFVIDAGEWLTDVFATRADEGFEGSGYDWASLAQVFLDERMPELAQVVAFDPEGSMFSAYATDTEALARFARAFHAACQDRAVAVDLFSRAELD